MSQENRSTDEVMNKELFYAALPQFCFSYSSLSKLINAPKFFREEYIYGNKNLGTTSFFDIGKLIHCMVLEPDLLEQRYIRLLNDMADGNTKDCVIHIFNFAKENNLGPNLEDYSKQILTYLQLIALHQSLKTDQQRVDKICTPAACEYFQILFRASQKNLTVVSNDHYLIAMEKSQAILNDEYSRKLLKELQEGDEWVNEIELTAAKEKLGTQYGLKGVIDRLKFNNVRKEIYITDLKHTSKTLDEFKESAEKYLYPLQGIIYKKLLESFITGDSSEWKIYVHFTVVDKKNDVYSFLLSRPTMDKAEALFYDYMGTGTKPGIAKYQIENEMLDLPYKYMTRQVTL